MQQSRDAAPGRRSGHGTRARRGISARVLAPLLLGGIGIGAIESRGAASSALPAARAVDTAAHVRDAAAGRGRHAAPPQQPACDPDNGGITLPDGFCAFVVADRVGQATHLAVAPNGDLYVALRQGRDGPPGGVLALRDTTGDGRADVRERFGESGGTGLALRDGNLYFATDDAVLRYRLDGRRLTPAGPPETIVQGLPADRGHRAKTVALDERGNLFVNVGSPSNACQREDREPGSPGLDPCPELETRAGIWRFDAGRTGQTQTGGERFATGIRNALALTVHPENGALYGLQHGRDQLHQNWPELFTLEEGAERPSEILVRIERGDDFGWPYCYHDPELDRIVLAPEYGGDGEKAGRCEEKEEPLVTFPGHWGPHAIVFYGGKQFPERYRGGAFVAFHGSWNRAPLPQGGYNVAFVPFDESRPAGPYQVFADGFAGPVKTPDGAEHRPAGIAQGPDGSLYVSDNVGGRIWRIVWRGAADEERRPTNEERSAAVEKGGDEPGPPGRSEAGEEP